MNPNTLQYSAHSATSLYTGTRRCWLNKYFSTAEFGNLLMRNCTIMNRYFYQILLSIFYTFSYSCSYLTGFAQTMSDNSVFISNHNNGRKTECTTTFGNFGYPLNANKPVFKFQIAGFNFSYTVSHNSLEF